VVEYKDILKLIACTDEFDARLLTQPALDLPRTAPPSTRSARGGSLDRLMARVQTRDLSPPDSPLDDWTTTMVTFTTVRPLDASAIPADPQAALPLPGGVKVKGHRGIKAKARLTTAPLAKRELGTLTLPAILGENPAITPPFVLAPTRSGDPGLSVLELTDVEPNSEALVTPEDPLCVEIPQPLGPGEHLLPIGFDGEFFLPLGSAMKLADGTTEVRLDRIPAPTVAGGTRSLTGSIRIFFQKVISQVIGTNYPYPILAVADVDANENLTSIPDPAQVKERVAQAQRILLFVHGIIGDTQDMAKCVQRARLAEEGATLRSRYDLVLTFDYENLNTKIEQNARSLKQRLEAAGLGANHGKTLHLAAHSMGGLVSRWFIEREGGDKVVQKLVMLGTPNGGSPWPNVVDWGTATLALGLNHLTVIPWSGQVVSWLEKAIEQVKVDLGEMQAGSEVLKRLAESPDPKIPYLMVAGNTSLPPQVVEPDPSKGNTSILQRLLKGLRAVKPLELAANQLFAGVANDIAVSQESMRTVPASHTPPYDVREVACDHLTYFNNPVGLDGLIKALW
jgi:pimeloyl-ACP methyl ester carboxylesterase